MSDTTLILLLGAAAVSAGLLMAAIAFYAGSRR